MVRSLARRLATLETHRTPVEPRAIGIVDCGEYGTPSNMVQLAVPGGGERLTLDEWQRRSPYGTLVRFVYADES